MEEQATEREQERDDFTKEIDNLKGQLREKDKECNLYIRVVKEVCANASYFAFILLLKFTKKSQKRPTPKLKIE